MRVSFTVRVSVMVIQVAILSCNCEVTQPRRLNLRKCAALTVHVRHPLHYFDQRRVDIADQVELLSPRQVTHLPPVWDILLHLT